MTPSAFLRLTRFHKPAGILLLWAPTAWALWIANQGMPPFNLLILFLAGTVIMRAAGCVMNDIADRNIDLHVARTKLRPLTSGEVSLKEAFLALIGLLFSALLVLLQLPTSCFYYAIIALLLTLIYPFCKRVIQSPQLVLGLAFSMGIPMAYVASGVSANIQLSYLFLINFAWILVYDTQYAMADRADDLLIGVKSTAILFGNWDKVIIGILQFFFHALWIPVAVSMNSNPISLIFWLAGAMILVYQQWLISSRIEKNCIKAFSSNSWYGLVMWIGVMVGL